MGKKLRIQTEDERVRMARNLMDHRREILQLWEEKVRSTVPAAKRKTSPFLRNDIPRVVESLAEHLMPHIREVHAAAERIGREHGEQRAEQSDYALDEVLQEYQILRQVLFDFLLQTERDAPARAAGLVLDALDESVRHAATRFLEQRSEELRRSNRDLEHFAAIAAHDLKSPLGTISGYMELLGDCLQRKGVVGAEEEEYISAIKRSAARMSLLIDRLLEYASLGQQKLQFDEVDLNDVIQKALENLKMEIDASHARVLHQTLPAVHGDATLLLQVLQNLVHNAIKFRSERPPEIKITVRPDGYYWIFSVHDNGAGFDAERKHAIFALFAKMHEKNQTGAGIGLATCRKIVELHGGKIWAESEKGKGSVFHFSLPRAASGR